VKAYITHLDRLMAELGIENHDLAEKANTSRQAIWKLRNGYTRMLPNWAKRLAPHLGISWHELVEGSSEPADQTRSALNALIDVMNEEQRRALLTVAQVIMPHEKTGEAPLPEVKTGPAT
jgi:hypothetical protein